MDKLYRIYNKTTKKYVGKKWYFNIAGVKMGLRRHAVITGWDDGLKQWVRVDMSHKFEIHEFEAHFTKAIIDKVD